MMRLTALSALWACATAFAPNGVGVQHRRLANTAVTMNEDLSKSTVVQLKEQLKAAGLPVSGKKEELIARLGGGVKLTISSGESQEGRSRGRPPYMDGGDNSRGYDRGRGSGYDRGRGGGYDRGRGYGRGSYGGERMSRGRGGRGRGRGGGLGPRGSIRRMQGDWTCQECGANCFASRDTCFRCGADNPKTKQTPWQGLNGDDDFDARVADDEAAFRQEFG